MSLSGWRPAVVRSLSSRNRLPAFGPRMTSSRALPGGSAPNDSESGNRSSASSPSSVRPRDIVEVVSPGRAGVLVAAGPAGIPAPAGTGADSGAPQFEQNRAPSGFGRPHRAQ